MSVGEFQFIANALEGAALRAAEMNDGSAPGHAQRTQVRCARRLDRAIELGERAAIEIMLLGPICPYERPYQASWSLQTLNASMIVAADSEGSLLATAGGSFHPVPGHRVFAAD